MPDLPPDWALPMQEIMLHSACELQMALTDLDGHVKPEFFNARDWKIAITLNPKSEADIVPGAGLTRKVPFVAGRPRFSSWVFGSGNGVTADMKGNRTGSVDFNFDSEKLILDKRLPCERQSESYHALTKHLAIRDWLYRAVEASSLAKSTIDNPKFTAQVVVKFGGTGSYTYTFPPGADLLSLSGYYQIDQTLNIVFTKKPKVVAKFDLTTLPEGGAGFKRKPIQESIMNWTLQSTSQIETPSPDACYAIGNQLIAKIDKVNTMTVRAYCLCADGDGKTCKGAELMATADVNNRTPTVEAIGRVPRPSSGTRLKEK